jgi:digeranylgeranylglycerophospholipid reductase
VQYKLEGSIATHGFIDFYLWPNLAEEGYLWVIPKNNNTCNVGIVSSNPKKIQARLDHFIKIKGFQANRISKIFGGKIPSSGPFKHTFSNGLLMVGDAAGFTSPFFEGGTHLALKSGYMAAKIALESIQLNDFSIKRFSRYQKQWKKIFPNYKRILKGKRAFCNFSDADLNLMATYIPKEIKDISTYEKGLAALRLILESPYLIRKGSISMLRAFEYSRARSYGW